MPPKNTQTNATWQRLDPRKRLVRTRTQLLIDQPFWGELAMQLRLREATEAEQAQMRLITHFGGTNGKEIVYLPDGTDDEDLCRWGVPHEICHCMLGHIWRRGNRDPILWNIATDAAVNYVLLQAGFKMPDGYRFVLPFEGLEGAAAERIYLYLQQQQAAGESSQGLGGRLTDDHNLWPKGADQNTEERAQLETQWKAAVSAAAMNAQMQGKLPLGLERLVGQVLAPKIDWKQVLAQFMQSLRLDDYTWNRVRKVPVVGTRGAYFPRLRSEGIRIAIGLDTSGSISGAMIHAFLSEVAGILWSCGGVEMTLYVCDAAVHAVWHLGPDDPIPDKVPGGGGTNFCPVFDRIAQDWDDTPDALVFFTDSYGTFPEEPPDYPVLWIVDAHDYHVPWGDVVEYRHEEDRSTT